MLQLYRLYALSESQHRTHLTQTAFYYILFHTVSLLTLIYHALHSKRCTVYPLLDITEDMSAINRLYTRTLRALSMSVYTLERVSWGLENTTPSGDFDSIREDINGLVTSSSMLPSVTLSKLQALIDIRHRIQGRDYLNYAAFNANSGYKAVYTTDDYAIIFADQPATTPNVLIMTRDASLTLTGLGFTYQHMPEAINPFIIKEIKLLIPTQYTKENFAVSPDDLIEWHSLANATNTVPLATRMRVRECISQRLNLYLCEIGLANTPYISLSIFSSIPGWKPISHLDYKKHCEDSKFKSNSISYTQYTWMVYSLTVYDKEGLGYMEVTI